MRLVEPREVLGELRPAGLAEAVCDFCKVWLGLMRGGGRRRACVCGVVSVSVRPHTTRYTHILTPSQIHHQCFTFRPREVLLGRVHLPDLCDCRLDPRPRLGGGRAGIACVCLGFGGLRWDLV